MKNEKLFKYVQSFFQSYLQHEKGLPHKPMTYLTEDEIEALLKLNEGTDETKVRDYALLTTLYNTGARVQEICDLKVDHLHLKKPFSITLTGKGKKTRTVPLWKNRPPHLSSHDRHALASIGG